MFEKLKNLFGQKLVLTDQELAYLELLKVELSKKETVKCTPPLGIWYVVNAQDRTIFRIGNGMVAFAGPTGTSQFMCSFDVSDKFRRTIEEVLTAEAQGLEDQVRARELEVFDGYEKNSPDTRE